MFSFRLALLAVSLSVAAQMSSAQQEAAEGQITIELNAVETVENACKLTFIATNTLTVPLDRAVFETVLFDKSGTVDRLTLFDFGALPVARPRVRQFVVPQIGCEQLGRILYNKANVCDGDAIAPEDCEAALKPTSRTGVEVLG